MLEELCVSNYALIDDVQVSFSKGFNVLSGETGAGKSLLVGALGLIFGKKGSPSFVRQGCEDASISAVVDLTGNEEAKQWLKNAGISYEDNQVLIKRNIKNSGRGSQNIEGQGVIRSQLEEFSALLFDMHGQHEHQSLFNKNNHRKLLDKYGRLTQDVYVLNKKFQKVNQLKEKLKEYESSILDKESRVSTLEKAIKEITEADLNIEEEELLEKELKVLRNTDNICSLLNESLSKSSGAEAVVSGLKLMVSNTETLSEYDEDFTSIYKRLKDSYFELEDIYETLKDYKRNIEYSPEVLQEKEQRLSQIYTLEKKYGTNIKDVLEFLVECKSELNEISSSGDNLSALKESILKEQGEILELAKHVSKKRKDHSLELESKVIQLLSELSLPNVRFKVDVKDRRDNNDNLSCGPWGMDEIEFLMSMNPGEPLKPVKQIASGGEISRIMLALKSVLADVDSVGCLIFDEIDSGIGGEVAISIGEHLKKLSKTKQILSITHLASIASYANNHLMVVKNTDGVDTNTDVVKLENDKRVREIARMLSGECNEASMNHARELLE